MGKGKKVIILGVTAAVVLYILYTIVVYSLVNIASNSVYYAKNLPHSEDTDPVISMLIENMDEIHKVKIKNLKLEVDEITPILFTDDNGKQVGYLRAYTEKDGGTSYDYFPNLDDGNRYLFDKNFTLYAAFHHGEDFGDVTKVDITTIDQEALKADLKNKLSPIIQGQEKPHIDLQWLFNSIYEERFN